MIAPKPEAPASARAERRRAAAGKAQTVGQVVCKFCKSQKGTFYRLTNKFVCKTFGCKGAQQ